MINTLRAARYRLGAAGLALALLPACSALRPTESAQPALYSLDSARVEARVEPEAQSGRRAAAATLIVNPPRTAAGFDSRHIIYTRVAYQLEHYARSEWVDSPARMIAPLIVGALEADGRFRAVVLAPSVAAGDLRLDTEIIRLQHELFSQPSRMRVTLRAYLVDNATRSVQSRREFDESVAVTSEDPYGAVVAANRAVRTVLGKLAAFCADAAGKWQAPEE